MRAIRGPAYALPARRGPSLPRTQVARCIRLRRRQRSNARAPHASDRGHGEAPVIDVLLPIPVLDLARRDLVESDLQVVLGARLDHRRRVLVEGPLAEV